MLDLLITGGDVIDGSGAPRQRVDIGVRDGRIVAIGTTDEPARRTVDATDRIVAPGFVDIHTHVDAQAFWDPDLSPSPLHGVTTAIAGNCGFTIAPLNATAGDYLMKMLAKVEGMPLTSLETGVPWNWRTTAEYLDALEGTLAINVGFMVGHSAMRRVVMGESANARAATDEEIEQMAGLLRDGLRAGGFGFSTTTSTTHNDGNGDPVPSRFANLREFVRMAEVTGEFPGTSLEFLPKGATNSGPFDDETAETMIQMSLAAQRPLNWNVISPTARNIDDCLAKLELGDRAAARGAKIVGLTMPVDMKARFSFHAGFVLDMFDGWATVMNASTAQKMAEFADPVRRRELEQLAAGTPQMGHLAKWESLVIVETFAAENDGCAGRRVGDIAAERGTRPFDTLADIALADEMRTTFARSTPPPSDDDWRARQQVWSDPRAMVGASDAGAHLDMIAAFRYATEFIAEAVRYRNLISLEEAVHHLTARPADLYGLHDVGRLTVGSRADILVFDPATIGSQEVGTRFDLPGGAGRLYAEADGIDRVFVNGVEIATDGKYTGERAGRILRSGIDSATPSMSL
jgi:N-acyl-D-aspartate/D-glutamate deacylase